MYFYKNKDSKIVVTIEPVECENLTLIDANTTDAATEKHVPAVEYDECCNKVKVQVGDVIHPMIETHYIQFIALKTDKHEYLVELKPNQEPVATFTLTEDEKPLEVYEFCNLHGLWKKEI